MIPRTGFSRSENGYGTHAIRTGQAGEAGLVKHTRWHSDGKPDLSTMVVLQLVGIECDFWFCTCRESADNDDHFFSPLESA